MTLTTGGETEGGKEKRKGGGKERNIEGGRWIQVIKPYEH